MRRWSWCLLIVGATAAQDGFRALPAGTAWPERAAVLAVDEPGGSRLEADGARLLRVRGGARTELACTLPGGPGAIRALAAHDDGTTYVAAVRGLFMISPEVEALDPLDLRDGVPPGTPIGLSVDGERRLWVATETGFGCLDTDWFFGAAFGARDGLPPPPFDGFAQAPDGELWLRARGAIWAYRPGARAAPDLRVVEVASRAFDPAAEVEVDGPVAVSLASDAPGTVTFRYRRLGHHLWLPLEGARAVLPAIDPGRGGYETIALDRELNASAPVAIRVRRAYPWYYDKRFLLPIALLAGLAVLGAFLWRSRGRGARAQRRAVLSAALLCVLGLQLLAAVLRHGRSWPFIGFSMYTEQYHEQSLVHKAMLLGEFADGSRAQLFAANVGMATDGQWQMLLPLIHGGSEPRARWLRAFQERHPDWGLRALRVQTKRYRLTPDGPVEVAPIVLARHPQP